LRHQTKFNKWKIMSKTHVKHTLLLMLDEFDIEKHFDSEGGSIQVFEHQVGFEYAESDSDDNEVWHEAYADIIGTIHVKLGLKDYHNPIKDGRLGENQGEPNTIEDWHVDAVRVYVDNQDHSGLLTITEVANRLEQLQTN